MPRLHNSPRPVAAVRGAIGQPVGRKPAGFWWADGSAWTDFVERTAPDRRKVGGFDYVVELTEDARIAQLEGWQDIVGFTEAYAAPVNERGFFWLTGDRNSYEVARDPDVERKGHCRVGQIDWRKVAEDYDGIEVVGYAPGAMAFEGRPGVRPRVEWLDIDWAVSSGCVWRPEAVRSLALMEGGIVADQTFETPAPR